MNDEQHDAMLKLLPAVLPCDSRLERLKVWWMTRWLWRVGLVHDADGCSRRFGMWHVTYSAKCICKGLGVPYPPTGTAK